MATEYSLEQTSWQAAASAPVVSYPLALLADKLGARVDRDLTSVANGDRGVFDADAWRKLPTSPSAAPIPRCAPGSHSYRVVGRLPFFTGEGCQQPLDLRCSTCGHAVAADCGSSNPNKCRHCAAVYGERVQRVALVVARDGEALMLTVTAPGSRQHYRDGKLCPCTPAGGVDLAKWNARNGERWNRLCQDLRRYVRSDLEYFRAVETQGRGALHDHVLLRRKGGGVLVLTDKQLERIGELVAKHGYGHRWQLDRMPSGVAASYVAKYVSKAVSERRRVPWRRPAKPGEALVFSRRSHATYRTWTASRSWGLTMRSVKAAQRHYLLTCARLNMLPEEVAASAAGAVAVPDRPLHVSPTTGEIHGYL